MEKNKTTFGFENDTLCVRNRGRAYAAICKIGSADTFFTSIYVITGFRGENQILLTMTRRQDGNTNILVVHSQVDTGSEVIRQKLVNSSTAHNIVLEILNSIWE